jgi:hypothetical protein
VGAFTCGSNEAVTCTKIAMEQFKADPEAKGNSESKGSVCACS